MAHPAVRASKTRPASGIPNSHIRITVDHAPTDRDLNDPQSVATWFLRVYRPYRVDGELTFAFEDMSWRVTAGLLRELAGYELLSPGANETVRVRPSTFVARRALGLLSQDYTIFDERTIDDIDHVLGLMTEDERTALTDPLDGVL